MDIELMQSLGVYLTAIVDDYKKWSDIDKIDDPVLLKIRQDMLSDFEQKLEFVIGKKYIKVISNRSAHSFIVIEDDAKFKRGDILMSASWAAPARNFARGNILGDYKIRWTGAAI